MPSSSALPARFGSLSPDEEAERQELEIEDLAHKIQEATLEAKVGKLAAQQSRFAADTLLELRGVVEAALACDPKLDEVIRQIRSIRMSEPETNMLIYTEYKDSQQRLVEALLAAGFIQPLTLSGEDSEGDRLTINTIFRTQANQILVATDAAAEGLNLQHRCHHLIHLELPWNPNRTEQRNGRIDRYGQTLDPQIRLLFLCGTFEERILARLIAKYELQRKHLRFVPNTLGLGMNDLPVEGLFALLTDEHATTSMGRPCRRFNFEHPEEVEGDQEVAILLAEIDKSLRGFEKATHDHTWLSIEGAFAEDSQPQNAVRAFELGKETGGVDLLQFVCDAVRLEGGIVHEQSREVIELNLPPGWRYELEGFPGWYPETGKFRLTNNIAVEKDVNGKPVGFLGRSHPLVKRAVDHIRHLEFGQENGPDRRVSAAYSAGVSQPTLIVTFLSRLQSEVGREWEQIFALRLDASSTPVPLLETASWLPDLSQSAPTRNLWKQQFSEWGEAVLAKAKETAQTIAETLSQKFTESHQVVLEAERRFLNEWLMSRAQELIGPVLRKLSPGAKYPEIDVNHYYNAFFMYKFQGSKFRLLQWNRTRPFFGVQLPKITDNFVSFWPGKYRLCQKAELKASRMPNLLHLLWMHSTLPLVTASVVIPLIGKEKATVKPVIQQYSLFDTDSEPRESLLADAMQSKQQENVLERAALYQNPGQEMMGNLASFAAGKSRTSRERGEAEVVLSVYQRRMRELDQRANLRPVEVSPVGLLMLLPTNQK